MADPFCNTLAQARTIFSVNGNELLAYKSNSRNFILMRLRDQILAMRDVITAAATASGADDVRMFGSVARGDEGPGSDVDFLVSLEPGRTLMDLARLEARLEELLGRPVDVVTESSLREPIRTSALHEALRV